MHDTDSQPILFPTDFQSHSESAFEHAVRLAQSRGSKLIALHVSNMPDMAWSTTEQPTHHEYLKDKLQQLRAASVEIERVFAVADPGPEICRLANELGCGMIVMGVTNKSGMDQLICGSVHDYVQQNANCAVATLCQQPEVSTNEGRWR